LSDHPPYQAGGSDTAPSYVDDEDEVERNDSPAEKDLEAAIEQAE
jgi:hypothetical protein